MAATMIMTSKIGEMEDANIGMEDNLLLFVY